MNKSLLLISAILLLALTGCLKVPSTSEIVRHGKNPLGVDAPDAFDWSNTQDISITLQVDDQFAGQYQYKVEVFTTNPITDSAAQPLRGVVTSSRETISVTIPKGLGLLYLRQTDPLSRSIVQSVAVSSGSLSCDFSSTPAPKNALGRRSVPAEASTSAVIATPSDAIPISGGGVADLESGKSYVIVSGTSFSGSINYPGNGGATLFVEGDLLLSQVVTLQIDCRLIVQSTGKVRASSTATISMIGASSLQIAADGSLKGDDIHIYLTDKNGSILNLGELSVGDVTFATLGSFITKGQLRVVGKLICTDNTSMVIDGSAQIEDLDVIGGQITNHTTLELNTLTINSNNATFINNATVVINSEAKLTNTTFHNHCLVTMADRSNLTLSGSVFFIHDGAQLSGYDVVLHNGKSVFDLGAQSMLDVRNEITISPNANMIRGVGREQSLARLKEVKLTGWESLFYQSVQVEVSKHTQNNNQWDRKFVLEPTASMVAWGESTVTIAKNDCSGTGNTPGGGSDNPEDQDDLLVYPTTYTYLFEDNWPYMGDYDLNDIVVELTSYQESVQQKTLTFNFKLLAVGATKRLGAALQFDGVEASQIESFSIIGGESGMLESGQTYGVIFLFTDAHKLLSGLSSQSMINTSEITYEPKQIVVALTFKDVAQMKAFTISRLNLFITTSDPALKGRRKEIHLNGYAPTDLADVSFFGTGDDNSKIHLYKSVSNYVWGIMVPRQIAYPLESRNISLAYPDFSKWVASGGQQSSDWYIKVNKENICK